MMRSGLLSFSGSVLAEGPASPFPSHLRHVVSFPNASFILDNTTRQIHFPSHASHFSPSSFFFLFFPSFLPLLPSLHFLPSLFGHIGAVTRQVTTKTTRSLCASQSIQARPESNQESPSKFSGITQKQPNLLMELEYM